MQFSAQRTEMPLLKTRATIDAQGREWHVCLGIGVSGEASGNDPPTFLKFRTAEAKTYLSDLSKILQNILFWHFFVCRVAQILFAVSAPYLAFQL
jgi:hypothetical protein